jgi:carbon storage regulator
MLVLTRKKNESIVINNEITILVVEIRGDKVRLGVEAPKEVPVHRREVYDAIKRAVEASNAEFDSHQDAEKLLQFAFLTQPKKIASNLNRSGGSFVVMAWKSD